MGRNTRKTSSGLAIALIYTEPQTTHIEVVLLNNSRKKVLFYQDLDQIQYRDRDEVRVLGVKMKIRVKLRRSWMEIDHTDLILRTFNGVKISLAMSTARDLLQDPQDNREHSNVRQK